VIVGNFLARIDNRINPVVVKELRQAVQSRFVVAALLILLGIQLLAIGLYLIRRDTTLMDFDAGNVVFMFLYGILLFVSLFFVPLYAAIRLIAERSDANVDLLFVTTIKPRSIITGKITAATIISILIFSACMPFMTFTYFLRGVDLPSIFIVLAMGLLIVVAATQMAIFVACIPGNRASKLLMAVILLVLLLLIFMMATAGGGGLIEFGIGSRLTDWQFWKGGLGFLAFLGLLGGIFFALSVALIKPVAANRALPVRSFITIAWAVIGAGVMLVSFLEKSHMPVIYWQIILNWIFALALFVAISERAQLGRRVMGTIPGSWVKRAIVFPFYSGAASGLFWACTGICLTLLTAWLWSKFFSSYSNHADLIGSLKWIGAMCLYFFCYALSAALLRRWLLVGVLSSLTWLIGLILMVCGIVVPFMIGYLLYFGDHWWDNDAYNWLVGNPFAWTDKTGRGMYLVVAAVWGGIVALINLPWFIKRVREFRPAARKREAESGFGGVAERTDFAAM
jgi:hypothetical protein